MYMDEALYGVSGFYTRGGQPGTRDGDFATSVELGSLFGRCVAGYLDRTWHDLGRPDPFVVVEVGAGRGTLCAQVLRHASGCREALHYVMVERVTRQRNEALTAIRDLDLEFCPPVIASADLPAGPLVGVVIANELLDNLPFRLLERTTDGWHEVYVEHAEQVTHGLRLGEGDGTPTDDDAGATAGLVREVLHEALADAVAMADTLVPDAEMGARIPLQLKSAVSMRRALNLLSRGGVLIFDYGVRATAELAERPQGEWLRTYRSQRRGHDPLHDPGRTDITCEVAFDQLPAGATLSTQADWLTAAGIDELTADARALWQRHRSSPTAAALAARALLSEAAALTDPAGMGAFWAAEWHVD